MTKTPQVPDIEEYKAYIKRLEDAILIAEVMYHPIIKKALDSKPRGLE